MKTLVIAEKPSVGKDIARALGCGAGGKGCIEGGRYVVVWAMGHLIALADPEKYNSKYKSWSIEDLPIMPDKLKLTVIPQTARQFNLIKELLLRKDIADVVIATDAGREGELVARWILEKAACNKPIKRLWISSVTDKAIKEGFRNLKDGRLYENLCDSAKARAEADWLVGINATRCLTTKYNSQLSCGRVQTPTVAIVAKREEEIRNFTPRKYYGITALCEHFELFWAGKGDSAERLFDYEAAASLLDSLLKQREGVVRDVTAQRKKKYPPPLYDLTELQRDANKRYGFSPKETLSIMQELYERRKALTYPRTDSRYLTEDIVPTLAERIRACAAKPYAKACMNVLKTPLRVNSSFVDNSKVSDHHAIIPTEVAVNLSELSDKERKIYDLVVTRFLSVFYPPFEYEQTLIRVKIGSENFIAKGRRVLSKGYAELFGGEEEDGESRRNLPDIKVKDTIKILRIQMTEGKTVPPPPYNEATLLSAMESPIKLGTVATRADIIEKLFDNFLIEKKGKDIFTTSKGRQLLTLVPKDLRTPELTGDWESKLMKISDGKMKKEEFLRDIRKYTDDIIKEIKKSEAAFRHDNLSSSKCPECGKFMLTVNGKKGKMLVCQDRECNGRMNLSFKTRAKCPDCRKFLEIVGEGEKKRVVCSCGYRERYDAFEKRKKEERNQPSKNDIQSYIKKINSDDAKNNPFAAIKDMF